jgi:predicted SprT family Zn-dependent metalloprotease
MCAPCTLIASRKVLACAVCGGEPTDVQRHKSTRGFIWVCVDCRTGRQATFLAEHFGGISA